MDKLPVYFCDNIQEIPNAPSLTSHRYSKIQAKVESAYNEYGYNDFPPLAKSPSGAHF